MKAIVRAKYGSPDVLELKEVEQPTHRDNEVLIKVCAASANPADWHVMRGDPFIMRLAFGLFSPKYKILGADIAGRVESVGINVKQFQKGDEVFGSLSEFGGFAEYACASERELVLKPAEITFEEAASVPIAAITALQGLRDHGRIKQGQKVLINGASGGVGTFAVQIAKAFGAIVTGVCSTRNLDIVRSLGADHVIDYTRENFTLSGEKYDLILDAVANFSVSDYRRAMSTRGVCFVAGFTTLAQLMNVKLMGQFGNNKVSTMSTTVNQKDLDFLKELINAGKVVSVIDRTYPFKDTAEAIRYLEKGHARGKVIITLDHQTKIGTH